MPESDVPDRWAPRRRSPTFLPLLVVLGVLGFLAWRFFVPRFGPLHDPDAVPQPVVARGDLAEDERSTIVYVENLASTRGRLFLNPTEVVRGSGSGFVWDDRGYVVTNFHVVQGGSGFEVVLADRSRWRAQPVGSEPDKDVAVLKIDARALPRIRALPLGTSADLLVGQKVFAIGNPFGLDQTLTTGVISGLGRQIQSVTRRVISGVIQTDAAINPGNSGGPLLDSAGRLIGMNTAIYSRSGTSTGVGFAVPVDTINEVVPRIIRAEEPPKETRPGLGIQPAEDAILQKVGLQGVLVLGVLEGSAAEKAGMKATRFDEGELGDVIVAIDDEPIRTRSDLDTALRRHKVGEPVTVTVLRDERRVRLQVTLQEISD
jgi:S1-C subfamily serine protease